jgi:hypothetical protein
MSKMTTDERTPIREPFANGSIVVLGDGLVTYRRSIDAYKQHAWQAVYRSPSGGSPRIVTLHNIETWDVVLAEDIKSGRATLVSRGDAGCAQPTGYLRHENSNVLEPSEWCMLDREYDDDLCAVHHRERLEQLHAETV